MSRQSSANAAPQRTYKYTYRDLSAEAVDAPTQSIDGSFNSQSCWLGTRLEPHPKKYPPKKTHINFVYIYQVSRYCCEAPLEVTATAAGMSRDLCIRIIQGGSYGWRHRALLIQPKHFNTVVSHLQEHRVVARGGHLRGAQVLKEAVESSESSWDLEHKRRQVLLYTRKDT